jgi:cell division transport system permease protein
MMINKTHSPRKQVDNRFLNRLLAYFYIHAQVLFSSLGRLFKTPVTLAMTVTVMAVAVTLAAVFYLLVGNMQTLTGSLEETNQISVYLKPSVDRKNAEQLAVEIRKHDDIEKVTLISKEQGMRDFKAYSGFGDTLNMLDNNPLPIVLQVLPKNTLSDLIRLRQITRELSNPPQVDLVRMDMEWVQRLQSMVVFIQRGVFLLTILLGVAVLFITGNTIRLELQSRHDEILVLKLVGATYSFIQRPFLYTGFWLGFISGVVAWVLVTLIVLVLDGPIESLSMLYNSDFEVSFLSFVDTVGLLFIASFLGILGAWGVLSYQILQIKPK